MHIEKPFIGIIRCFELDRFLLKSRQESLSPSAGLKNHVNASKPMLK